MKNVFTLTSVLLACSVFSSCDRNPYKNVELKTEEDTAYYYMGLNFGNELKNSMLDSVFNYSLFKAGFYGITQSDSSELLAYLVQAQLDMLTIKYTEDVLKKRYKDFIEKNDAFLEKNAERDSVVSLPDGIQYIILKEGQGKIPSRTDMVKVDYICRLIDGTEIENTYKTGNTTVLRVINSVSGWKEILQLMPAGSIWRVYIPSEMAFGSKGMEEMGIPPFATLIYEINLHAINP